MRIRTIKPEFFKHDGIAALPPLYRLLFVGLWGMADSAGRLEDRPLRIKAEVLPYDEIDVNRALQTLADAKFIVRYHAEGLALIEITSFARHQRLSGKEAAMISRYPAPEQVKSSRKGKQQGSTGEAPVKHPESLEGKGREGKGKEGKEKFPIASQQSVGPQIPLLLNTPQFAEVWNRWMEIRQRGKKPKTPWPELFAEQLRWLEKLGSVDAAIESVSQSIRNGWQGLFEPKLTRSGSALRSSHVTNDEHAKGFFHGTEFESPKSQGV